MSYPSDPAFAEYPAAPPPGGPPPGVELAHWGLRVAATLIDWAPAIVLYLIAFPMMSSGDTAGVAAILFIAAIAWVLYMSYLTGARGQSIGKRVINIKVVRAQDGQVIGGGLGIARYFIHIVDSLPCYLGYLWPLWDSKRQTFTDKIMTTFAIKV